MDRCAANYIALKPIAFLERAASVYGHRFFALTLLLLQTIVVLGDRGTTTSYNPPYTPSRCNGNRQDQFPAGNLFVSVSEGLWDNGAACGRHYRVRCLNGNNSLCKGDTIVCAKRACPSTMVLSKISHSQAKINIEYISIRRANDPSSLWKPVSPPAIKPLEARILLAPPKPKPNRGTNNAVNSEILGNKNFAVIRPKNGHSRKLLSLPSSWKSIPPPTPNLPAKSTLVGKEQ